MDLFNRASLVSVSDHVRNETGHVATSEGNVLYAAVYHETVHHWNYMSHSVSRIQYCSCVTHALVYPR